MAAFVTQALLSAEYGAVALQTQKLLRKILLISLFWAININLDMSTRSSANNIKLPLARILLQRNFRLKTGLLPYR